MLNATFAAAEVVEEHLPHDAPTQARPPAQGGIHVGDTDDAVRNKMIYLARQSGLQTVGNMPGNFLVKTNGPFPQRRIKVGGALNRVLRGIRPANNLDQRD
jgi:hypothetical protein